jgi:hypothetical protein
MAVCPPRAVTSFSWLFALSDDFMVIMIRVSAEATRFAGNEKSGRLGYVVKARRHFAAFVFVAGKRLRRFSADNQPGFLHTREFFNHDEALWVIELVSWEIFWCTDESIWRQSHEKFVCGWTESSGRRISRWTYHWSTPERVESSFGDFCFVTVESSVQQQWKFSDHQRVKLDQQSEFQSFMLLQ